MIKELIGAGLMSRGSGSIFIFKFLHNCVAAQRWMKSSHYVTHTMWRKKNENERGTPLTGHSPHTRC